MEFECFGFISITSRLEPQVSPDKGGKACTCRFKCRAGPAVTATQGNASADAAQTYLLFWLAGQIDTAEKYLALFCTKSDTAKQYVEKWLSIVSASRLPKARAEEKEFLLHWANVVDYE
ncbi:MAG: hypothetical protein LBD31_01705 [Treponema sp.]|jgi:hypothetical protein|nr:hypothetical protein [Treponema sp.]